MSDCSPLNFQATFGQSPAPLVIDVDPHFIEQTRLKASFTRVPNDDMDVPEFIEGVPSHTISDIARYWTHNYDWAVVQKQLNTDFQHFTTTIPPLSSSNFTDSIPLHFIHHRSPREDAIPVIFIHGWPGSFLEVSRLLPLLTHPSDPTDPAFHVVAPSLPGFGFSPAPKKPGLGLIETAEAFNALMHQLGYDRYVIQGGDFGGHTSRYMAAQHPESVVSILPNMFSVSPSAEDLERRAQNKTSDEENAYMAVLDAGKPLTNAFWGIESYLPLQIGALLGDSPVLNALWPYQGMRAFVPGYEWSVEEIITWGMMLYIQGPYGNVRMYRELLREGTLDSKFPYVSVPVGILEYFDDAGYGLPDDWSKRHGNVVYHKKKDRNIMGGHFPAYTNPEDLAKEIRGFWGSALGGW